MYPVSKHGKVASARIYSAGLAYNNLSLNGTRTSDRYLDPPFTNYYDTAYYRTEDVTKLLRQEPGAAGENVIATQLGSGHFDQESITSVKSSVIHARCKDTRGLRYHSTPATPTRDRRRSAAVQAPFARTGNTRRERSSAL